MKCDNCGKDNAVINIRQIIGNDVKDLAFCRKCAEEKGILGKGNKIELSIDQILDGLLVSGEKEKKEDAASCPSCGMKAKEAGRDGRIGCSECINAFPEEIRGYFKRNDMDYRHKGKLPEGLQTLKTLIIDREKLKTELKKAVESEDYENAAVIRDRINEIDVRTGAGNE